MIKKLPVVIILLHTLLAKNASAQGCSDAGFCTIGHLKQLQAEDEAGRHQKISILLPAGLGDESVFVFTPGLQYDNQLNKNWSIQAKLTANTASGNLGNATGFGDVFLSGTYTFPSKAQWKIAATLGVKLPLQDGNLKEGSKSLPMQYQSSLGTVDIISGISITNNKWQFAAGWQQPISGKNRNQFLPAFWNTAEAARYSPSQGFNRKADVLLRAGYLLKVNKKLDVNGGLLGIYHIGRDKYTNQQNQQLSIAGSDGLTLNITLATWYKITDRLQIGCTAGAPLVARNTRPDGLTRKFVFDPEISWSF